MSLNQLTATKSSKNLLASFVQVVVFLFAAFGGFLKNIAPPDETNPSYHVGIVSFLALIILLIIAAVSRRAPGPRYRRVWIGAGIVCFVLAVPCAFLYPRMFDKYTYQYPPPPEKPIVVRVQGSDSGLTEVAKEWVREHPQETSPGVLARKFPPGLVWTPESIEHAKTTLLISYSSLALSLATAIFCLIEANAGPR